MSEMRVTARLLNVWMVQTFNVRELKTESASAHGYTERLKSAHLAVSCNPWLIIGIAEL